jgi:transposase
MMSRSPNVIPVSVDEIERLLSRLEPIVSPEDFALVRQVLQSYIELARQVAERGTTIARLRRLFGLSVSEKTADVLSRAGVGETPSENGTDDPRAASTNGDSAQLEEDGATRPASVSESAQEKEEQSEDGEAVKPSSPAEPGGKPKKKGHGRIPNSAYTAAHRHFVPHGTLTAGERCPGCACGNVYDMKRPPEIARIFGQAALIAHIFGLQQLRCGACGALYTAEAPEEARGDKYDETATAMIGLLHYGAGMPFHRLERIQSYQGTPIPASTQWDLVNDGADLVSPAYKELCRQGAQASLIHGDDTYAKILALAGKRRSVLVEHGELENPERTGCFTTGTIAITDHGPIALFSTGRAHAGENLDDLLDKREAHLPPPKYMCDALSRNLPKRHIVDLLNCLAHGRREIVDQIENFPQECRTVLELLGEVYQNDRLTREQQMSDLDRLRYHQRKSGPVLGRLKKWINTQFRERRIEPNSDMGKALRYILRHWPRLTRFLRVPGAPIDNNICERALKLMITYRKNSYFFRSERGAFVGDVFMSLIYTAELHDENPFDYLTELQRNAKIVAEAPAEWMPWNYRETLARLRADTSSLPQAA